jgi:hypothetical protein
LRKFVSHLWILFFIPYWCNLCRNLLCGWGMRFNAKKCYILSINKKSNKFYSLDNHILQQSSANSLTEDATLCGRSLMWQRNTCSIGPSTVPWGTPESTVPSRELQTGFTNMSPVKS